MLRFYTQTNHIFLPLGGVSDEEPEDDKAIEDTDADDTSDTDGVALPPVQDLSFLVIKTDHLTCQTSTGLDRGMTFQLSDVTAPSNYFDYYQIKKVVQFWPC